MVEILYESVANPALEGEFIRRFTLDLGYSMGMRADVNPADKGSSIEIGFSREYQGDSRPLNQLVMDYNVRLASLNPLTAISLEKNFVRPGSVIMTDAYMPRHEWRRTDFYNEFYRKFDWDEHLTIIPDVVGGYFPALGFTRDRRQRPLDREEMQLIQIMASHIQKAWRIRRQMNHLSLDRDAAWSTLDTLGQGVAIIDSDGNVLFLNRAGEEIVSQGGPITCRDARLACRSAEGEDRLQRLVLRAIAAGKLILDAPPPDAEVFAGSAGHGPVSVFAYPLRLSGSFVTTHGPACIVFMVDPSRELRIPVEQLSRIFDLTPAEARVALCIARGLSVEQCATQLGHSVATSRTLLKRVFAKTGTSRQNELASRVLAHSAGLAGLPGNGNHGIER